MNLTFVEMKVFSSRWHERLDDDALRELQTLLLRNPTAGKPIPGCGLLRKLRFADPSRGKGKRSGVRVIYMHTPEASRIDLIIVYGKDEADDLTPEQLEAVCGRARVLRGEAMRSVRRPRPSDTEY